MIEDAIKLLEEKVGKEKIKTLEIIEDVDVIKNKLNEFSFDIEIIKREYLAIIESANYYSSSDIRDAIISIAEASRKTLANSEVIIDEQKKTREQVSNIQDMLVRFLAKPTKSIGVKDSELLGKMSEHTISQQMN